ncbi:MAG: HNH endonuclease [Flavobacteriaceae bacterium]|jgi:uncharacterized protein (TIGR02646 family)|nr:HNH endonuclease [Flavobacteriaceae bacterium]
MIELKKTKKPQSLADNGDKWTKDLMVDYYQTNVIDKTKQNKYNKPDIKQALILETNEKCAYCESKVTHIYPGDIEHIIPKALYPRLTFSWNNLTFGCYWCNNKKRDFLSKECMLLNPYKDKINFHLRAFGPIILHVNNSKRGEITWRKLELNRTELRDKRLEKIEELKNLIDKLNSENIPALKSLIENEIMNFIDRSEFSFTLKQFFEDNKNVA